MWVLQNRKGIFSQDFLNKNFKYYLNTSSDLVAGLEGQIQAYGNSVHKKSELYGDLCEEFRKLRSEIEKNIYITYPVTCAQVIFPFDERI